MFKENERFLGKVTPGLAEAGEGNSLPISMAVDLDRISRVFLNLAVIISSCAITGRVGLSGWSATSRIHLSVPRSFRLACLGTNRSGVSLDPPRSGIGESPICSSGWDTTAKGGVNLRSPRVGRDRISGADQGPDPIGLNDGRGE